MTFFVIYVFNSDNCVQTVLFIIKYTVLAAEILNLSLTVLAVGNCKPVSKHSANPNSDRNPIPNGKTYSLLQSAC